MDIKTTLVKASRLFLAATFIISAAAKIYSMHFFDGLVASQLIGDNFYDHPSGFFWVQILTRVLIAGEFMLGVAILQKKYLKKIVLPVMALLLVIFSLQVFYEAQFNGKGYIGGNCGCFGEVIPFDNLQTLIKNIVLLLIVSFVQFRYKETEEMTFGPVVPSLIVGIFTFFTMYLTIENIEETTVATDSEESTIVIKDNVEHNTTKTLSSKFDFTIDLEDGEGVVGELIPLTVSSIDKDDNIELNQKMWFLLPDADSDSIAVLPGGTIAAKYSQEGVFDVKLIVSHDLTTDTIIKTDFIKIKNKEIEGSIGKINVLPIKDTPKIKPKEPTVVKDTEIKSNSVFAPYRTGWSTGETKDLEKGTHLICMFSLTCGHCQAAYRDILEAQKKGAKFGTSYILGYGGEFDLKNFWRKTGKESPYIMIERYPEFAKVLKGGGFPKIILVENGVFTKTWTSSNYSKESFFDHFGISETKEIPESGGNLIWDKPNNSGLNGGDLILEP